MNFTAKSGYLALCKAYFEGIQVPLILIGDPVLPCGLTVRLLTDTRTKKTSRWSSVPSPDPHPVKVFKTFFLAHTQQVTVTTAVTAMLAV